MTSIANEFIELELEGKPRTSFLFSQEDGIVCCSLQLKWPKSHSSEVEGLLLVFDRSVRSHRHFNITRDGVMGVSLDTIELPWGGTRTFGEVDLITTGQYGRWFGKYSENRGPTSCGTQLQVFCETEPRTLAYYQVSYGKQESEIENALTNTLRTLKSSNPSSWEEC